MNLKHVCKIVLPALLSLAGCAAVAPVEPAAVASDSPQQGRPVQVIVQFKSTAQSATDTGLLQELANLTGLTWQYLRPMSGGSHVYQLSGGATDQHYHTAIATLQTHPAIAYAEVDRIMRPMR